MKKDKNGFYEKYHSEMLFAVRLALTKELRDRTIAQKKAKGLQEAHDTLFAEHQEAIGKHDELLKKLDEVDDAGVIEAAEALAGCDQQKAAIRQKLHFVKIRLKSADDAVKKAQAVVDARFKAEISRLHAPFQQEIDSVAQDLANRINDYEQAILQITKADVGVEFLIMSKHSKPWLTLRLPELEDYT